MLILYVNIAYRRFFKSCLSLNLTNEVLYRFEPFKNEVTSGFPNSNSNTKYPAFEVKICADGRRAECYMPRSTSWTWLGLEPIPMMVIVELIT